MGAPISRAQFAREVGILAFENLPFLTADPPADIVV
jgi:hypothetical protein